MSYKLRDGTVIIDEAGNLHVKQGASLYVAGEVFANNETGTAFVANNNNQQLSVQLGVFSDNNPLTVGQTAGYFAGGDIHAGNALISALDNLGIGPDYAQPTGEIGATNSYNPNWGDPTAHSAPLKYYGSTPVPEGDRLTNTLISQANISRFPFSIDSADGVVKYTELKLTDLNGSAQGYPINAINNGAFQGSKTFATGHSSGTHGYIAGGYSQWGQSPTSIGNSGPTATINRHLQDFVERFPYASFTPSTDVVTQMHVGTYGAVGFSSRHQNAGLILFDANPSITAAMPNPVIDAYTTNPSAPPNHFPLSQNAYRSQPSISYVTIQKFSFSNPSTAGAVGGLNYNVFNYQFGWTADDVCFAAGDFPQGSPSPSTQQQTFSYNSVSGTHRIIQGIFPNSSEVVPFTSRNAGASVQSPTYGYGIGQAQVPSGGSSAGALNQPAEYFKFPFANMVGITNFQYIQDTTLFPGNQGASHGPERSPYDVLKTQYPFSFPGNFGHPDTDTLEAVVGPGVPHIVSTRIGTDNSSQPHNNLLNFQVASKATSFGFGGATGYSSETHGYVASSFTFFRDHAPIPAPATTHPADNPISVGLSPRPSPAAQYVGDFRRRAHVNSTLSKFPFAIDSAVSVVYHENNLISSGGDTPFISTPGESTFVDEGMILNRGGMGTQGIVS